jgi:UDP-GlcNAc:undecaprenyl-phosphate GlcNAc-1-phosphate transferase
MRSPYAETVDRPANALYLAVFVAALVAALVVTPAIGAFARRLGVADQPGGRKAHVEPVSLLGGLAIYAGAFVGAWALVPTARPELKGFFLAGFVVLVFGLQDDLRPMDPWTKLLAQLASALVLVGFGVQVSLTHIPVVDVAITVLWVVGVINAINYADNMNGLAAGIAAIAAAGLFGLAFAEDQYLVAVLGAGLAGGCLGFLRSNYPKARIFMGDSGAMFLGFVLAFLSIRLRFLDQPKSTTFVIPALVLFVPLFDATLVTISRYRRGVPVTQGGTDHTSHRLVRLGMKPWAAVALLWALQALFCLAAIGVARGGDTVDVLVVVGGVVAGLGALVFLERAFARGDLGGPTSATVSAPASD